MFLPYKFLIYTHNFYKNICAKMLISDAFDLFKKKKIYIMSYKGEKIKGNKITFETHM